ncbi:DsbA family protein [Sphingomonas floccifaciens]|uniref:DsbA family protein n=1 Tax=Sphingomonas floccifaciens TaxID=1844115 RepID=A0ABW4NCX6_9SPHN
MRTAFALAAAVVVMAAAPPAAKDWRQTVSITPTGSVLAGNPAAKVKLVEYLSFTCSHCAHFAAESKAPLHDALVRQGKVQVETRAAVRDPFDLAAWSVAKCAPPQRFTALAGAIFAQQQVWTEKGDSYAQANLDKLKAMAQPQQIRAVIDNSGLGAIGAQHGVTPAALNRCLANPTLTKQLVAMTDAAFKKIPGTPGFEVNGKLAQNVASWDGLAPQLAAAGAK